MPFKLVRPGRAIGPNNENPTAADGPTPGADGGGHPSAPDRPTCGQTLLTTRAGHTSGSLRKSAAAPAPRLRTGRGGLRDRGDALGAPPGAVCRAGTLRPTAAREELALPPATAYARSVVICVLPAGDRAIEVAGPNTSPRPPPFHRPVHPRRGSNTFAALNERVLLRRGTLSRDRGVRQVGMLWADKKLDFQGKPPISDGYGRSDLGQLRLIYSTDPALIFLRARRSEPAPGDSNVAASISEIGASGAPPSIDASADDEYISPCLRSFGARPGSREVAGPAARPISICRAVDGSNRSMRRPRRSCPLRRDRYRSHRVLVATR